MPLQVELPSRIGSSLERETFVLYFITTPGGPLLACFLSNAACEHNSWKARLPSATESLRHCFTRSHRSRATGARFRTIPPPAIQFATDLLRHCVTRSHRSKKTGAAAPTTSDRIASRQRTTQFRPNPSPATQIATELLRHCVTRSRHPRVRAKALRRTPANAHPPTPELTPIPILCDLCELLGEHSSIEFLSTLCATPVNRRQSHQLPQPPLRIDKIVMKRSGLRLSKANRVASNTTAEYSTSNMQCRSHDRGRIRRRHDHDGRVRGRVDRMPPVPPVVRGPEAATAGLGPTDPSSRGQSPLRRSIRA